MKTRLQEKQKHDSFLGRVGLGRIWRQRLFSRFDLRIGMTDSGNRGVESEKLELPEAVGYLLANYDEICEKVTAGIRLSGMPQKVFYLELGISRATFDRRMRNHDWKVDELQKLLGLIGSLESRIPKTLSARF